MISLESGIVKQILKKNKNRMDLVVEVDGRKEKAINYIDLTGEVKENDKVLLNTTAMKLKLGTGGYHFVLHNFCNHDNEKRDVMDGGHIMKLRYTPLQFKVFATEEQESPHHKTFLEFRSLEKMPVIVGSLHSMLLPISTVLKYLRPDIKIGYIMTDAAALPIALSNTVELLKENHIIDKTITIGHAYGGDLECINIYNALIAAKEIAKLDIVIVTMGPGIVGTGTPFGFTGVEQGVNLDAVELLGGTPIAVPRISFSDFRSRHRGISHHSLTVLDKINRGRSHVIIPELEDEKKEFLYKQINNLKINEKHYIVELNGNIITEALSRYHFTVDTMGRGLEEDLAFFQTCGAAAQYGLGLLEDRFL
ncbi:DUF3866 family protein [Alkaliphilus transvaalensis]|uniref:DUF3866 family protein n=1 Tax=Alkaliphilus transvaalensis TaxID=114628 RepID=UPI00047D5600|nr:DUF3866 family protein [Alkaliphilus transvaalensis]